MGIAPDGSPVGLYARLPELGEGEVVATALPAAASVLELGCGTGRITRQLVRLGYRVTAVDESAEMLAHVRDAETVRAEIEGLRLGRRFDAALETIHRSWAGEPVPGTERAVTLRPVNDGRVPVLIGGRKKGNARSKRKS